MTVRNTRDVPTQPVAAGQGTTMQVLISAEEGPSFAMRKFSIAPGGGMPRHVNTVEHEQYVLGGRATVEIGDEVHHVTAGDVVLITRGMPHSYRNDGDEPFEFLCMVPNEPDAITILDEPG